MVRRFACCDSLVFRSWSVDSRTDSRPCRSCRPSWPARDFLLLVQEKVTKENTPSVPRPASPGSLRADGFDRQAIPGLMIESARSLAPPACGARGFSARPSPWHRGFESQAKAKSWVPAFAGTTRLVALLSLSLPGSLSAAARARRKKPVGARARGARVRCQARDGLSANLRSVLAKSPASSATAVVWVASLGLLSLARQRK